MSRVCRHQQWFRTADMNLCHLCLRSVYMTCLVDVQSGSYLGHKLSMVRRLQQRFGIPAMTLETNVKIKQMSYYAVFNVIVDICDEPLF